MPSFNNFTNCLFFFRKVAIFVTFKGDHTIRFSNQLKKKKRIPWKLCRKTLVSPHFSNPNFKPIFCLCASVHVMFLQHRRSQDLWLGWPKSQITSSDVIRNFERGIFCGDKDTVEWKIRSRGMVLARNYELVQRGGLKPIVKIRKHLNWETCWVKKCIVIQTYYWRGSGGKAPSLLAVLSYFFEKKAVLTSLDHISHVFRAPFEST